MPPVPYDALYGWFITDAYLLDWISAAVMITINEIAPDAIGQLERPFSPNDPALSYPLKPNTIPSSWLYVMTFVMPSVIIAAIAAARGSFADGHHGVLTLVEGFALATSFKRWMTIVGRYRPNWLAALAAGTNLDDGRQAYPSGHATYIFNSGVILTCFLIAKLCILQQSSPGHFPKVMLCLCPLFLAAFVSMTRIADYKHDFSDVNAGCFIGIATGLLAYFMNYPSLLSERCREPKLRTRDSALHTGASLANAQRHVYGAVETDEETDKPTSLVSP